MSIEKGIAEIDTEQEIAAIIQKLNRLPDQIAAPNILKDAINDTTRQIRRSLNKYAKKRYAISDASVLTQKSKGATWVDRATQSNQTATILSTGPMLDLMSFLTNPGSGTAAAAAKVINENSQKSLEMNGLKAFVTTFASGHTAIVQRHPPDKYTRGEAKRLSAHAAKGRLWTPDMTKIKKLLGPAVPHMMGIVFSNNQVEIDRMVYDMLQTHIQRRIDEAMAK